MSIEENKAIVGRWFTEFWGKDFNPAVIDELAAPDIRFEYSLHAPCRAATRSAQFATEVPRGVPRPQLLGTADLIAEGDYVVGQWEGGGTHTGDAFDDMPVGSLPPAPVRRCGSPAPPCSRSRTASSPRKSGSTTGSRSCGSLALSPRPDRPPSTQPPCPEGCAAAFRARRAGRQGSNGLAGQHLGGRRGGGLSPARWVAGQGESH